SDFVLKENFIIKSLVNYYGTIIYVLHNKNINII
ncbi:MAG: hypothetical protein RIQ94_2883, partial [Pseudomonadota bacterium]